jgi:uncharacterized DUF497 family protein
VIYEWDPVKAAANVKKHRVTFEEAASVFLDPAALTFSDPDQRPGASNASARSAALRSSPVCDSAGTLSRRPSGSRALGP